MPARIFRLCIGLVACVDPVANELRAWTEAARGRAYCLIRQFDMGKALLDRLLQLLLKLLDALPGLKGSRARHGTTQRSQAGLFAYSLGGFKHGND